ncbi:MAG: diguanylate cyclase [bacterium]
MTVDKTIVIPLKDKSELEDRVNACLLVVQGREIGRDYRLRQPEYYLGRDFNCEIMIPETSVSRKHAYIQLSYSQEREEYEYTITDLGSTNGTYVNNKKITSVFLHDGDKIRVGNVILKFELRDAIDLKFQKEIQKRLRYDGLTNLLTKESFYLALETEIVRAKRYNLPLSVFMMDLDHFKEVNDRFGHQTGSHTLQKAGELIGNTLRSVDVSARYGGDEFISYLVEQDKREAYIAATRLQEAFCANTFRYENNEVKISISIGVSLFPVDGSNLTELVKTADQALYRAKEKGRNCVCLY